MFRYILSFRNIDKIDLKALDASDIHHAIAEVRKEAPEASGFIVKSKMEIARK